MNYDGYWQSRSRHYLQPRHLIIARHLVPGESVLDVGCGDGAMLEYFIKEKHVQGFGIDISPVAVERARARGLGLRYKPLMICFALIRNRTLITLL